MSSATERLLEAESGKGAKGVKASVVSSLRLLNVDRYLRSFGTTFGASSKAALLNSRLAYTRALLARGLASALLLALSSARALRLPGEDRTALVTDDEATGESPLLSTAFSQR